MNIDHIHFFVEDAVVQRDWFVNRMGCCPLGSTTNAHTFTEIVQYGTTDFYVSSPRTEESPVTHHLAHHAPGVVDVALQVENLESALNHADESPGAESVLIQETPSFRWATVKGWGSVKHTLIESRFNQPFLSAMIGKPLRSIDKRLTDIDHVVLNVPTGELRDAADFYQKLLGLEPRQRFQIETPKSGLKSQVLYSPSGQVYFNINEPATASSQIQVFLNANHGAGIQHIALKSESLWQDITKLRAWGLPFLSVPITYYKNLQRRIRFGQKPPVANAEWQHIVQQEILVDWQAQTPNSLLLQIFSKPIFPQPTFFLSLLSGENRFRDLANRIFRRFMKPLKQNWIVVESC